MAITVKHTKVSLIPDSGDDSLIEPSDWNDDHVLTGTVPVANGGTGASTLTGYVKGSGTANMTASTTIPNTDVTGLGTMSTQNANNVAITGGSISGATVSGYIPTSEKAQPLGVATLDASGKVPTSQIPLQGDLNYQGTWNASTNTPTLTSSTGTQGYYYVVSVAGTTNLNGITDWQIGDWAIYNGSVWQKVDNTDAVSSVNGQTGTVVLTTTNIAEGTNEYFTTARARASVSAGTGISYNSTTGVITNSSPSLGGDVVGPASATDNAIARYDTTTGKLIQNSVVIVNDAGTMSGVESVVFDGSIPAAKPIGTMWYDSSTETLNFQQNNITQQIGEEILLYGKASAAINDSPLQIIYQTGVVGASGHVTFAPTVAGITNPNLILGCATEPLATNQFGRITTYGTVHNITTNGTAYGETWADGDVIWYNPVTGNPTKNKPTAPNMKVQLGIITHAGNGGSGSFQVLLRTGSELGGTDSNVNIVSPTAAQILTYDSTDTYWKNTSLASGTGISTTTNSNGTLTVNNTGVTSAVAGTGISVSGATGAVTVTNTAPDQTVVLTGGTGISTSGTYPNFTITNTAPSLGGTVTSVGGTGTVNGITLSGTVTSSGNLTLGGTLSGVSLSTQVTGTLPIANGGTGATTRQDAMDALAGAVTSGQYLRGNGTDVVMSAIQAADVPTLNQNTTGTASNVTGTVAVANGGTGLTSLTANRVPYGNGTSALGNEADFTYDPSLNTVTAPQVSASNGIFVNSATVSASYSIPSGSNAMSAGTLTIANGITVTVPNGNTWTIV